MALSFSCQVLRDGAGEEQDHDNGGCDPKGAVEVGVAVEHIEKVGVGEGYCAAAAEDLVGVDVEELLVEGDAPKETLRG